MDRSVDGFITSDSYARRKSVRQHIQEGRIGRRWRQRGGRIEVDPSRPRSAPPAPESPCEHQHRQGCRHQAYCAERREGALMHVDPEVERRKSHDKCQQRGNRSEEDKREGQAGFLGLLAHLRYGFQRKLANLPTDLGEPLIEAYS